MATRKQYRFGWSPKKAASNRRKHDGITFEEAVTIFEDPLFQVRVDNSKGEERLLAIGLSVKERLLLVVTLEMTDEFDQEENVERYQIISARKVTPDERQEYKEGTW